MDNFFELKESYLNRKFEYEQFLASVLTFFQKNPKLNNSTFPIIHSLKTRMKDPSHLEDKIKRATKFYGMDKEKAEKEMKRIDKMRENHYKHYTEKDWRNPENYDVCINSDTLGVEKAADFICQMVKEKQAILQ